MTKFYDLSFGRHQDGSIELSQTDARESKSVRMHPAQLRHVAESFGLVAPNYPADELTKRLAHQLCEIRRELADECYRSHWLGSTYDKLDAYCNSIPDAVFPYEMFVDEAEPEAPAKATGKASPMPTAVTASHAELTAGHAGSRAGHPTPFELTQLA